MRCNVVTASDIKVGDRVTLTDGIAKAFVNGKLAATLVNARVTAIGDKWIAIEGMAVDFSERRQWWCEVGAEKP